MKRICQGAAISACLAFLPAAAFVVPDAQEAHDQTSPETVTFRQFLDETGAPTERLTWSRVEKTASGLVVHDVAYDVSNLKLSTTSLKLGDIELTDWRTDGTYPLHYRMGSGSV